MEDYKEKAVAPAVVTAVSEVEDINASGHRDQLKRHYSLWHTIELMLLLDNAWPFFAASLSLAIYNGGPPGVIYELLVACIYYSFIAASIAELASAIPSSGGIYHFASIAPGPKWGRTLGYFAGTLNSFAWFLIPPAITNSLALLVLKLYQLYHDDYIQQPWHIFVIDVVLIWLSVAFCIWANKWMPSFQRIGCVVLLGGFVATIVVLAAMPTHHATNSFVWSEWQNRTGWPSGVAFFIGVLNGAIAIGTPESITHVSEELPNPSRDLPLGILAQMSVGTITCFAVAIAMCYGITDLDHLLQTAGTFPLTEIYYQATNSKAAAFGLTLIVFLSLISCLVGSTMTAGRNWWALARDRAVPFPRFFSHVNERLSCPVQATVLGGVVATAFSAIALGSSIAQADLVASSIIMTSVSGTIPVAANILTGRKNVPKGWFHMGNWGFLVNGIAVLAVIFFDSMFCFPNIIPTTAQSMNFNSIILVGFIFIATVWWFAWARKNYPGPALSKLYLD